MSFRRVGPNQTIERGQFRVAKSWTYAPRKFLPSSTLAAHRIRAERHNPNSITTLHIRLARSLLKQLACCPFCCSRRL
jgi:hypothetical protein